MLGCPPGFEPELRDPQTLVLTTTLWAPCIPIRAGTGSVITENARFY